MINKYTEKVKSYVNQHVSNNIIDLNKKSSDLLSLSVFTAFIQEKEAYQLICKKIVEIKLQIDDLYETMSYEEANDLNIIGAAQ